MPEHERPLDDFDSAIASLKLEKAEAFLRALPPALGTERPVRAQLWNRLAIAQLQAGNPQAALRSIDESEENSGLLPAHDINRGHAMIALGRWQEAEEAFMRVRTGAPSLIEAPLGLGRLYWELGAADLALRFYGEALSLDPKHVDANRAYAYAMLAVSGPDQTALFEKHREIANRVRPDDAFAMSTGPNDPDPGRNLRIGWLSTDLRNHPVGRNIMAEFQSRDRNAFVCICYADVARPDLMTDWFRSLSDEWHDVRGQTDREIAEQIHKDRIDILIVTASRFDGNRPGVAAYRPAPVQVSYHDGATSGMAEFDAWITDPVLHPADTMELFTEELVRLPVFYNFQPPSGSPEPQPLRAGPPTILSFGNPAKMSSVTFDLWASVLSAEPSVEMIFKYRQLFATELPRRRIVNALAARGIAAERLHFHVGEADYRQHLAAYGQGDISLDCYPFTGANTSFEALWMGVPVVTMAGENFISRVSAALLEPLGLGSLVAQTPDQFREIALGLLRDRPRRENLRSSLRAMLQSSPIMDGRNHARSFEQALRALWQRKCGQ